MSGKLAGEIKQGKPFGSLEEEALLNLRRTASVLERAEAEALKPHGLSIPQYNALRILRGAGEKGLACQEIAGRMVTHDPDVTRLIDRLLERGFVTRERSSEDRRVVVTKIAKPGLEALAELDAPLRALSKEILGHLGEKRLRVLIALLERARGQ